MEAKRQWWIHRTSHGCDNAYRSPLDQQGIRHDELTHVQEVTKTDSPMELAIECYEAYAQHCGKTEPFARLTMEEKSAWMIAASWIVGRAMRYFEKKKNSENTPAIVLTQSEIIRCWDELVKSGRDDYASHAYHVLKGEVAPEQWLVTMILEERR